MAVMAKGLVLLSVLAVCYAQQGRDGRWVWGTRTQTQFTPTFGVQQARSAPLIQSGTEGNFFRRISARSFPRRRYPANIYDVLNQKESPIGPNLRVPPKREELARVTTRKASRTPPPSIVTPGDIPYPFGAKPVDLGDGTSISWVPDDTLPVKGPSSANNGHSGDHFKPSEDETPAGGEEIDDERYTTLDKLNGDRSPALLPNPNTYSQQILGGLHPDEVHYADKDLVIIKGGGFHLPYELNGLGEGDFALNGGGSRVKPEAIEDNQLGEETKNSEAPVRVRPDELFAKVPLPLRFVNGNIPTIVGPLQPSTAETFSPLHQTQFQPLRVQQDDYRPSASEQYYERSVPKAEYSEWGFQTLDDSEDMIVQESNFRPSVVALPHQAVKRSANPKVVHYHYHSIGNSPNPIVNYQVDDKGVLRKGNRLVGGAVVQPQRINSVGNAIPVVRKPETRPIAFPGGPSELEDLTVPAHHQNSLVPKIQTPKRRPQPVGGVLPTGLNQPTTHKPISLVGDTDVNFLPPLPRVNPLAESGQPRSSHNPERIIPQPRNPVATKSLKGGRRFMEPRKLSIRQRSLRPRL